MGKNLLIQALRDNEIAKGKKGDDYFNPNASIVSYSTGIPVLDYSLGYKVNVCDKDGNFVDSYASLGITAGSYVCFIGKPSTSKTATAIKIAANIVRPFDNGSVMHFDLEQAMNYSRIQALTKFKTNDMKDGKYILRQEKCSLEDIKSTIIRLYIEKTQNPEKYKYNTGKLNEFGDEIIIYEPTVIVLDSIATITMKLEDGTTASLSKAEEITTQTERMRLTGEIGRFLNEIMSILREANIILIAINQIKVNPQMGVVKTPADILGLSINESLPGGMAPRYLAHILLKFTAIGSEKYTDDDEGFMGFGVKVDIIKSRVSPSLKSIELVYDMNTGIDMIRSTVMFAKDMGLISGNKNGYYFNSDKDDKFTLANMPADFRNNPKLYKIMHDNVIPILESKLSGIRPEEMDVPDEEANFYNL